MSKKKKGSYQTGRSNRVIDRRVGAKSPGKRKSRSGKSYFERRKNRSDKPGTMEGIKVKLLKYPKRPKASATTKSLEKYLEKVRSIDSENARRATLSKGIGKIINS